MLSSQWRSLDPPQFLSFHQCSNHTILILPGVKLIQLEIPNLYLFKSTSSSNITEEGPVFDLKWLPNLGWDLHSILNELSLLSKLEINFCLSIFSLDMGDVDGDDDISDLLLKPNKIQHNSSEIWRLFASRLSRSLGGLGGDQSVCWCFLSEGRKLARDLC